MDKFRAFKESPPLFGICCSARNNAFSRERAWTVFSKVNGPILSKLERYKTGIKQDIIQSSRCTIERGQAIGFKHFLIVKLK